MKKIPLFILLTSFLCMSVAAQDFPVKEWETALHEKPLIFYISGDGGMNSFSNNLCKSLNGNGYDVYALNAKSYFWNRKTPEQTATDINNYLVKKLAGRKNRHVVLIGYSFGADVLPFVVNRLSKTISDSILVSFLMASSGSTDFEVHWSDIFGGNSKRSMDVVTEINKLSGENMVIINGSNEEDLALNKISIKYTHEVLPGGHHFDGDTEEIAKVILKHI